MDKKGEYMRPSYDTKECKACGKKAPEDYRPLGTKYAAHEVV